ncbi:H2 finger protein [Seminavis robusta]|uniref:H2 finger protein n=1 Tax=Seminavis robusta TaxID=568900 RepID=A0A9N8ETD7_9STRA|nr:H2 finger protein [Seminavis robusta]|eukprot:Sro2074_g313530.1 H2 finger protein (228) ;mRNA; r:7890-8573
MIQKKTLDHLTTATEFLGSCLVSGLATSRRVAKTTNLNQQILSLVVVIAFLLCYAFCLFIFALELFLDCMQVLVDCMQATIVYLWNMGCFIEKVIKAFFPRTEHQATQQSPASSSASSVSGQPTAASKESCCDQCGKTKLLHARVVEGTDEVLVVRGDEKSGIPPVRFLRENFGCCAICLGDYQRGDTICSSPNLKCSHIFHKSCALEWLKTQSGCPVCRRSYVCTQ